MGISNLAGNNNSGSSSNASSATTYQGTLHPSHPASSNTIAHVSGGGFLVNYKNLYDSPSRYSLGSQTPTLPLKDSNYNGKMRSVHLDTPACTLIFDEYTVTCVNVADGSSSVILDQKELLSGVGYTNGFVSHTSMYVKKLSANTALCVALKPANIAATSPAAVVAYIITVNTSGILTITTPTVIVSGAVGLFLNYIVMLTGTTKFVVQYSDVSGSVRALVFEVSGTTINVGTSISLGTGLYLDNISLAELSGTRAVWVHHYSSGNTASMGYYQVLNISGLTLSTAASPATFSYQHSSSASSYLWDPEIYNAGTDKIMLRGQVAPSNYGAMHSIFTFLNNATTITFERGTWFGGGYHGTPETLISTDNGTFVWMSAGSGSNSTNSSTSTVVLTVYTGSSLTSFTATFIYAWSDLNTSSSYSYSTPAPNLMYDPVRKKIFATGYGYYNSGSYNTYAYRYKVYDVTSWVASGGSSPSVTSLNVAVPQKSVALQSGTPWVPCAFSFHPSTNKIAGAFIQYSPANSLIEVFDKTFLDDNDSLSLLGVHTTGGNVQLTGLVTVNNLTTGSLYYVSNNDGSFTTTSTSAKLIGRALTSNTLFIHQQMIV